MRVLGNDEVQLAISVDDPWFIACMVWAFVLLNRTSLMKINVNSSGLRQTRWFELVERFVIGGIVTVRTGLVSRRYGPAFGGLFLAFPAIFPLSATLIEKHERAKKERVGMNGKLRGITAAALDASGASLGAIGLIVFAVIVWQLLPYHNIAIVLAAATSAWILDSSLLWRMFF
jgi:Protein of unknown function (DUF3147)